MQAKRITANPREARVNQHSKRVHLRGSLSGEPALFKLRSVSLREPRHHAERDDHHGRNGPDVSFSPEGCGKK
jgi:hypothetical protein